jgi:hypothetical protein
VTLDARTVWDEILSGSDPGSTGVKRRRLFPDGTIDLFLGVAWPARTRLLALQVANDALGSLGEPASTRAVRLSTVDIGGGRSEIRLELATPDMLDVFSPFIEDVAACAAEAADDRGATESLRERFSRWRTMLAGLPGSALSPTEAQGLWGELLVIRNVLQPHWGDAAPEAWTASDPDEKDFRRGSIAVEAKATRVGHPQAVRINGEYQLEAPSDGGTLLLVVVEADVHEGGTGETLTEAVDATRSLFSAAAAIKLEDRLIQHRYSDADEAAYRSTRYATRAVLWHEVTATFPRLVATDLPVGVGDVNYLLSVDACSSWRIDEPRLSMLLGQVGGPRREP